MERPAKILDSEHYTPLTQTMIDECPAVDIHVHVPGTITPQTAWELGLRNGLIRLVRGRDGRWVLGDAPHSISPLDPMGKYSNIFCSKGNPLSVDENQNPVDLEYNFNFIGGGTDTFKGFDAVMATVQGHRYPPGGLQSEDDYRFVMQRYLESCKAQNIRYTEVLQNIFIAQVLYKNAALPEKEARAKFFRLCADIVKQFAGQGVHLHFHNCPNKTSQSMRPGSMEARSLEWVEWLKESATIAPGVFVGLNSAGHEQHEKDEGGPEAMAKAYRQAADAGFGCEAHAGEGIGVEHMMDTMQTLAVTRLAHGVQVIESAEGIAEVKRKNITLVMMPCINVALHSPIHMLGGKPHAKLNPDGTRNLKVKTQHIANLSEHPFFPLLREHTLAIALAGDDPEMGGQSYKVQIQNLAGLGDYKFPEPLQPLSAEELALCNLNAIHAAFCESAVKKQMAKELGKWMKKHHIELSYHQLERFKAFLPR